MNRDVFKQKLENFEPESAEQIIRRNYDYCQKEHMVDRLKVITVEELSELQKEICKDLRGSGTRIGILEELADVMVCLHYIRYANCITDEELDKAIAIKAESIKERFSDRFEKVTS